LWNDKNEAAEEETGGEVAVLPLVRAQEHRSTVPERKGKGIGSPYGRMRGALQAGAEHATEPTQNGHYV